MHTIAPAHFRHGGDWQALFRPGLVESNANVGGQRAAARRAASNNPIQNNQSAPNCRECTPLKANIQILYGAPNLAEAAKSQYDASSFARCYSSMTLQRMGWSRWIWQDLRLLRQELPERMPKGQLPRGLRQLHYADHTRNPANTHNRALAGNEDIK